MALAARLERFLARKGITYRELPIDQVTSLDATVIASGMSQDSFVQATLLIDITGVVMAVHILDVLSAVIMRMSDTAMSSMVVTEGSTWRALSRRQVGMRCP